MLWVKCVLSFNISSIFNPFLDTSLMVRKGILKMIQLLECRNTEATGDVGEMPQHIILVSFMPSVCPWVYWQNTKKTGS